MRANHKKMSIVMKGNGNGLPGDDTDTGINRRIGTSATGIGIHCMCLQFLYFMLDNSIFPLN